MNSLNLLISNHTRSAIDAFLRSFDLGPLIVKSNGLRASTFMKNYTLTFYQMEKYEKYVSCTFDFENECSLSAEDIILTFPSMAGTIEACGSIHEGVSDSCMQEWNDRYIQYIIKFCSLKFHELVLFPPPWFMLACINEKKMLEKIDTNIARHEFDKKESLWKKWCNRAVSNSTCNT